MDKKEILQRALRSVPMQGTARKMSDMMPAAYKPSAKTYPCIHLNAKDIPALAGKEAGTKLTIVAEAYIKSRSFRETDGKKNEDFDIELRSVGIVGPKN